MGSLCSGGGGGDWWESRLGRRAGHRPRGSVAEFTACRELQCLASESAVGQRRGAWAALGVIVTWVLVLLALTATPHHTARTSSEKIFEHS